MIPLRLKVDPLPADAPIVTRLRSSAPADVDPLDAVFLGMDGTVAEFDLAGFPLRLHNAPIESVENDVLLILPRQGTAHRLIRASSPHNTLLVTERCDQLCLMCSQPPKRHHSDMFPYFREAVRLAPKNAYVGLSGGEPTLFKEELFLFLRDMVDARPDIRFHVLTNGQHFEDADIEELASIPHDRVLWGIPLYSHEPARHDEIVVKAGAFSRLMQSFAILARAGSAVELRTVVMKPNAPDLAPLARLVTLQLPFITVWALMQLENIGFGRKNWNELFFDNSLPHAFDPIADALNFVRAKGVDALLYNFPHCTVPEDFRCLAPRTISDWKQRYLDTCGNCNAREACCGFFEWYPDERGFTGVRPL
ncbi:His-Xaa-Ser system radical SAM maturase HxsC [Breoghania corrubedonensis]|uniref:His-Xaa-Ser system radical SAM maturase HxsC n=1 Tax=Breoghania corrubedonensis TaxID=665038 RepID=A0A2T5V9Z9_9HYPH|nr:His-Xaa-Ser system radical SAM maturase HxsC [Breoghania corrubedonensis]PTW60582.1 His-Xaa-Ser system radical SAM maturase HxsC [Breoghania corrubedonensis]